MVFWPVGFTAGRVDFVFTLLMTSPFKPYKNRFRRRPATCDGKILDATLRLA
jgi:hypothetical protein